MRDIISRFAPAPTGFLHVGHVVNAIHVWSLATRVLLRIEDHDRQRSRPEYERALERLRAQNLVYACRCSRAARYGGACRDLGLADSTGMSLRVRLEPSIERFVDLRHGAIEQNPSEQCGDIVIRDRDGNWTYQFAVTVDDMEQGVNLVIRGDDLLDSTGRQLQLGRLLGRAEPPRFLHHALIMKSASQKLSKSDHDTGIRDRRSAGWTPERVIGHAAFLVGLITEPRDVQASEVSSIIRVSNEDL